MANKKRNTILRKALEIISKKKRKFMAFKKSRRLHLLHPTFVSEYEFSPSRSPQLLFYAAALRKKRSRTSRFLGLLRPGREAAPALEFAGGRKVEEDDEVEIVQMAEPPGVAPTPPVMAECVQQDDMSVDQKAEEFIQRFYEQMRKQTQPL